MAEDYSIVGSNVMRVLNTWNITDGVTFTTETGHQNLVVFFDEVKTTIAGYECCYFFAVFDQLNSYTFTNGRIRLFSFNTAIVADKINIINLIWGYYSDARDVLRIRGTMKGSND